MPTNLFRFALAPTACWLLLVAPIQAQSPTTEAETPAVQGQEPDLAPPTAQNDPTTNALRSLATQLSDKRVQRQAAAESNDQTRTRTLDRDIEGLRWQFVGLITQIDVQQFDSPEANSLDMQSDLLETLRPLVGFMKDLTAEAREKHDIKTNLATTIDRRRMASEASEKIRSKVRELSQDGVTPQNELTVTEAKYELSTHWQPLVASLDAQRKVLEAKLAQIIAEENSKTWSDAFLEKFKSVTDSGKSILLAILAFVATFFTLRFLSRFIVRRLQARAFTARLTEVTLSVVTLILAAIATWMVPYSRDEYGMMSLGIIIAIGLGWVIAKSAPIYAEQIRLILNIGSVREGERILIDGIPYRVDALRFYCKLTNPALTGGTLRIPVGQLIGERSRISGQGEPWFPSKQGDFVAIENMVGRIQLQTPETVIFAERHDAARNYPTAAFLALNPRNLSNGFEISSSFGIDYAHQKDALIKIPDLLASAIRETLSQDEDGDATQDLRVELAEAGASSLDYTVQVDFSGKAAARYDILERKITQALVAACSKHGLGIPFPQVQVHGVK